MFKPFALAATLFVLSFAAPVAALDIEAMSDAERNIFRQEVRAYLLEHPEVLMEAIGVLESRQAQAQVANDEFLAQTHADALFNDGYSFVGGNPEGDITIVEFLDYRCSYCRRAHPEVANLVAADGNIRLIVKEYPILGEASTLSAQFAIAVKNIAGHDMYKDINDALMVMRGDTTPASLSQLALAYGLDRDAIFLEMNSTEVSDEIADIRRLGEALNITGTPTFIIQDQMLRGYVPGAQMKQIVDELREG